LPGILFISPGAVVSGVETGYSIKSNPFGASFTGVADETNPEKNRMAIDIIKILRSIKCFIG